MTNQHGAPIPQGGRGCLQFITSYQHASGQRQATSCGLRQPYLDSRCSIEAIDHLQASESDNSGSKLGRPRHCSSSHRRQFRSRSRCRPDGQVAFKQIIEMMAVRIQHLISGWPHGEPRRQTKARMCSDGWTECSSGINYSWA